MLQPAGSQAFLLGIKKAIPDPLSIKLVAYFNLDPGFYTSLGAV